MTLLSRQTRFAVWAVALLACFYSAALLIWSLKSLSDSDDSARTLALYWLGTGSLWASLTVFAALLHTTPANAIRLSHNAGVMIVLGVAIVMRAATIIPTTPWLSDDLNRYLIDGFTLYNGANPYAEAPAERYPNATETTKTGHAELVTAYQPTSQWTFATLIAVDSTLDYDVTFRRPYEWDHDKTFRAGFVLFDLLIIALLLAALRLEDRSPWWATLYAWHPLPISEVAASGHQDVIGIALLLASVLLVHRLVRAREVDNESAALAVDPGRRVGVGCDAEPGAGGALDDAVAQSSGGVAEGRRLMDVFARPHLCVFAAALAGVAFASAVGVKPVVLPIAGLFVWYLRRDVRSVVIGLVAAVLTGLALYLPFVLMEGGIGRMIETAVIFTRDWDFNSPIHHPLAQLLVSKWATNAVIWTAIAAVTVQIVRSGADLVRAVMLFLFASLLLSSTIHPWYLLWALAFVPLRFNAAVWVWSLTITFSYWVWVRLGPWRVPAWVMVIEYLPVFAAMAWSWWVGWRGRNGARDEETKRRRDEVVSARQRALRLSVSRSLRLY